MADCIYLETKDVSDMFAWFDHPEYEYTCKKTGKKIIIAPYIHCKSCKYYHENKNEF